MSVSRGEGGSLWTGFADTLWPAGMGFDSRQHLPCVFNEDFFVHERILDLVRDCQKHIKINPQVLANLVIEGQRSGERGKVPHRGAPADDPLENLHHLLPELNVAVHREAPVSEFKIRVADYELRELYYAMELDARVAKGCLREAPASRSVKPAKFCDGLSYMLRLLDKEDRTVAVIHHVLCESGRLHVFPSSVLVGKVNIYREGHQRPPWGRLRLRLRWEIGHQRRRNEMIRRAILPRLNRR